MSEQKPTFNWQDALLLDGQLDEEERLIRDSVHDFAQDRLMPLIVDWNRNEIFERELMLEFGQNKYQQQDFFLYVRHPHTVYKINVPYRFLEIN